MTHKLKSLKSGPRQYKEDYRYTTWDPISGRAARPGIAPDGIMPAAGFMSQEGKGSSFVKKCLLRNYHMHI